MIEELNGLDLLIYLYEELNGLKYRRIVTYNNIP